MKSTRPRTRIDSQPPVSSSLAATNMSTLSSPRHDFIDAFYGDIEQSLQEENSSNTGNASSADDGAVIYEVSSMVCARAGDENKSKTTNSSTLADGTAGRRSLSSGSTTAATPPLNDYASIAALTAPTPLGLRTPPEKRVKLAKIRSVEPIVKKSLYEVPSAQILGYRDYPQEHALQQQQQQQQRRSHYHSESSATTTIHAPRHNHRHHHPDPTSIQQKEKDRLNNRRSQRVLFVLALVAVICFAMICAVIILVVLNHLAQNKTTPNEDNAGGRLFLGPPREDYSDGPEPAIPSGSGTTTPAPTAASRAIDDPILASILASPTKSLSSSLDASCLTTTERPSHPPLAGKKGVALTLREEGQTGSWVENIPKLIQLNPYWNYSYEAKRIVQQPADIEFIPMIWTAITANPQWLRDTIDTYLVPQIHSGKIKRLLGFHEPDRADVANSMRVDEAIDSWKVLETAGLPIVSPAAADPGGSWMSSFLAQIELECLRADWVAVHWFDIPSFDLFRDTLAQYHEQYDRPLLLTEFAPIDRNATLVVHNRWSTDDVLSFMKDALPWLESTPWIAGYAWFAFDAGDPAGAPSALFDVQGNLTECGRYYASVRDNTPTGDLRIGTTEDVNTVVEDKYSNSAAISQCENGRNVDEPIRPLPGKKGLAMQSGAADSVVIWLHDIADMMLMNVSWTYTFEAERFYHELDLPLFLPSIADQQQLNKLLPSAATALENGAVVSRILGFDGPDAAVTDGNATAMSVEVASDLWRSLESTNLPLVSPSCLDPLGPWMRNFMVAVDTNCQRVDWIGVRWQGPANFHHFRDYVTLIHDTYQRPLMITQLSLLDDDELYHTPAEALTFMKQVIPWLEQSTFVDGYAWLPKANTSSALVHEDGSLTACGEYYASVSAATPLGDQLIQPDEEASL